jgi:GLPGLI family protein
MKLFLTYALIFFSLYCNAQYTLQGKIEYERKTNVYKKIDAMDDDDKAWAEKLRAQIPKFNIAYFDLFFNTSYSIYKPGRESESQVKIWLGQSPASDNTVYTDLRNKKVTASKQIYEEKFLIQDTMRHIKWKISDEIRTIANYKCRKAVGRICDSVYVVAFYTEDIPASVGPEMFGGLPGTILELAIPRLYTTWVATTVDVNLPKDADFTPPSKGKKATQQEMFEKLQAGIKHWGKYAAANLWWAAL